MKTSLLHASLLMGTISLLPLLPLHGQAGTDGFFPKGFTPPKMAVGGGGGVGIAGPTPFFTEKTASGASPKAKLAPTGRTSQELNAAKRDGTTDLMLAAMDGNLETVKRLLANGADVNATNQFGSTALMGACAAGHASVIQLLIEKNASVNATGRDSVTPLMFAARNDHPEIVQILLDHGADPTIKNRQGRTARDLARGKSRDLLSVSTKNLAVQPSTKK